MSPTIDQYTVIVIDTDGRVEKNYLRYDHQQPVDALARHVGRVASDGVWALDRRRQKGDTRMVTFFDRLATSALAAIENAIVSYVSAGENDDDA